MSQIPEARGIVAAVADKLRATDPALARQLAATLPMMRRRRIARRPSPPRSTPVTVELAAEIRAYAHANPDKSQQDIAEAFGTNHGRVSEALHRITDAELAAKARKGDDDA